MFGVAQVLPLLLKIGTSKDFLIANFGLHFSADYEGELRNLSSLVRCFCLGVRSCVRGDMHMTQA